MPALSCDTLIIGAGAAGLAAAWVLSQAGRPVMVLEARNRVGGRIWSRGEAGVAVPAELGAEFIHGNSPVTFSFLQKAGLAAIDAGGSHWTTERGRLKPSDDFFAEIGKAMKAHKLRGKQDIAFEHLLDHTLRRALSKPARTFARLLVEGFDAAEPALVSARAIVDEWTGSGAANSDTFRPLGGFGVLMNWLADEARRGPAKIQLDTAIDTVRWSRGHVEVEGRHAGAPFHASAKQAVITLPLAVLQSAPGDAHAVRFTPSLAAKQRALQYLAMGPVLKVVLRFRSAFWEELDRGRYRAAAFFHARQAPFPTFWTSLPVRTPMLVAWAGGPQTRRVAARDAHDVTACAVDSVQQVFGRCVDVSSQLEAAYFHDWQDDPYARGAYSYVKVGGAGARKALAAPLEGTLFFAGEAADVEGEAGTVAGALQSGMRAARAILRLVSPEKTTKEEPR